MNESNSIEAIDKRSLTNQTKFRLDEISKIENYFTKDINQRKSCSKKLSKYVAVFYYIDLALIVLSETLVSQALTDMEISHEEFVTIVKEKDKYEKMKDNLRSENEKYEIMRLSGVKSKT